MKEKERLLKIAVASSRLKKHWRNIQISWSDLVSRCTTTHYTHETADEYAAMTRDEQSNIKDVGGFVGGYLRDGFRRKDNVVLRSLATLDVDHAPADFADVARSVFPGVAWVIYSTHKHQGAPGACRYRLVMLFNREVTPEEYVAIARKVAEMIGIEYFDPASFNICQLMYWPSTSRDAEFVGVTNEGEGLNVDNILGLYHDWRDASEWAACPGETNNRRREMKKAGDPTTKPGVIGAFCRAYTIEDAIETFLGDVYIPTATPGRYTYAQGSVAGGLVCYDGLFAYSNHETDPAGHQCCNAFDILRIHMFRLKDEGSRVEDVTRLPSYQAMVEFARNDAKVKRLMREEQRRSVVEDFGELDLEGAEWMDSLEYDKRGNIVSSIENVTKILEGDPNFAGKLYLNEFSGRQEVDGGLPWNPEAFRWTDLDDSNLRLYLEKHYHVQGKEKILDAVNATFSAHRRHPIREYLGSLKWDGVKRLEMINIEYLGAADTRLNRAIAKLFFTAAVGRVYKPGVKFDNVMILAGPEGTGKSSLLKVMGGEWFNDSFTTTDGKEGMEQLRAGWIHEFGELASMKRSDVESLKAFISRTSDTFRAAYGRRVEEHKRQCVLAGTTNEAHFLKGPNGNRRFLPVHVKGETRRFSSVAEAMSDLQETRDQLWAEAKHYWDEGGADGIPLCLPPDLEMEARKLQEEYNDDADDPMAAQLDEFLERKLPADWGLRNARQRYSWMHSLDPDEMQAVGTERRDKFCAMEFVCEWLGRDQGADNKYLSRRIFDLMKKKPGWKQLSTTRHARKLYGIQRGFARVENIEDEDL